MCHIIITKINDIGPNPYPHSLVARCGLGSVLSVDLGRPARNHIDDVGSNTVPQLLSGSVACYLGGLPRISQEPCEVLKELPSRQCGDEGTQLHLIREPEDWTGLCGELVKESLQALLRLLSDANEVLELFFFPSARGELAQEAIGKLAE
ncbi:hypothetical protein Nepgr_030539 [Nepenthes gracilis]|uniref:Uncharacterized protein n=1 Tax=Nepenthes gracilis TaxID=150966 RepID=A0AAD3Y6N4_NEPGR|nr:hypothetical protein Nepgr_030539 [Nepenthes gracilis]